MLAPWGRAPRAAGASGPFSLAPAPDGADRHNGAPPSAELLHDCFMHDISSLKLIDLLLDAVCIVEADSRIVFVSAAFERIFGYAPQEVVGRRMLELLHPDDLPATEGQVASIMAGDLQLQFENRYVRKDGRIAHIRWTARWLPDRQVRLAVAHDITERKQHESRQAALYAISEAAHAAQSLESLFERIHEIIGRLVMASNFSVVLRDAASAELHHAYRVNAHAAAPGALLASDAPCAHVVRTGTALLITPDSANGWPVQAPADGAPPRPRYWLGVPLCSENGVIGALVLQSYRDEDAYTATDQELLQFVSTQVATAIERRQMHERLQQMAQFDALTRLPNRMVLMDRLQIALARARRDGTLVSLLFVDLDDFKRVNDSLGHAMGDLVLQRVAGRLQGCVRASDTVARLGGDEFVVLLESGRHKEHAQVVGHKILAAFTHPFDLEGQVLHMHPSIGTALYPDHGDDAASLLDHADRSMYRCKQEGGNQVRSDAAPAPARAHRHMPV